MTILIKGGLVYDGNGDEPAKEDILIRGEKILRRGSFSNDRADKVIDATGALITPGFIDVNSPADHYLSIFEDDFGENLSRDGVTTVIGGNCGASLAPAIGRSLFSLRKWADISKLNVDWQGFKELFRHLNRQGLDVNFGTLVGHGTMRRALVGDESRDLTEGELRTAKSLLIEALKEGALGFSTGLEFAHARSTPAHEIEELAKATAERKGIYATHLRSYGRELESAVEETIRIAKKTGVNLEISHLMPTRAEAKTYSLLREEIEKEGAKLRLNFDCNPLPYAPAPIYQFLPEWMRKENLEKMSEHLNAEHLEGRILERLRFTGDLRIGEMPPHLRILNGKSLRDYAGDNKLTPAEAMLKLMKISGLRGVLFKETLDENLLEDFVFSPFSLIASGEAPHRSVFVKFLRLADRTGKISLGKAVQKLTSLPAQKYGLKNRGRLEEGYYADLLVIKDFVIKDAVLNGAILLEEGEFRRPRSPKGAPSGRGKILKHEK